MRGEYYNMIVGSVTPVIFAQVHPNKPLNAKKCADSDIVTKARIELAAIQKDKGLAGTKTAWWREGFYEAEQTLRDIIDGSYDTSAPKGLSKVQEFHSFDEDGFI